MPHLRTSCVLRLAVALHSAAATGQSRVAVSKFTTAAQIANLRWDAITHLDQAISPLSVDVNGAVTPEDPVAWPHMAALVDAAHGNNSLAVLPMHIVSKPVAAQLFASPVNTKLLSLIASSAAKQTLDNEYDGLQMDIEGLQSSSKNGYEAFISLTKAALRAEEKLRGRAHGSIALSVTLYMPKLTQSPPDLGTYNITRLTELCDFVFLMGYDMSWTGVKMGTHEAGPNSPLDGLKLGVANGLEAGANASRLVLGLPLYGKLFTCDGTVPPKAGNCSCAEKNFHDLTTDIMAAAAASAAADRSCATGYNAQVASAWFDCPHGANIPARPQPKVRQQGWYETQASIAAKVSVARSASLAGIAVWTAGGADPSVTAEGKAIWDTIAKYTAKTAGGY